MHPLSSKNRSKPDTLQGLPAGGATRRAALRLLEAVLRRGQPLELALHGACQGLALGSDRALVHAIAAATLRHLPDLDALIDSATREPLGPDAKGRMVLRMALAQVLLLGTAEHAAVATALPLVNGGQRKLVHGVLGTLLRNSAVLPEPPALPAPVQARWQAAWGEAMTRDAAQALASRPPLDLSLKSWDETQLWAERLGGQSLAPGHVRLPADTNVSELPGYDEGAWWVQDLAASLPARWLGPGEGRHVLDLCAAPGGKTMQLAAAGWRVTAVDKSKTRLERMDANLTRTGLTAQLVAADLLDWTPEEPVDAILLDSPCSATGIFRRHPDVLHRVGAAQIKEMALLQAQLLDRAASWLQPGGLLIYATCSLEPTEGEDQVAQWLPKQPNLARLTPPVDQLPAGLSPNPAGELRSLPGMLTESGGLDGFFVAGFRHLVA